MCWITHFIQRSTNAKRTLCSAESNIRQTKRGSSSGPDQQKPNMLDLITFAKVTFIHVHIFFGHKVLLNYLLTKLITFFDSNKECLFPSPL